MVNGHAAERVLMADRATHPDGLDEDELLDTDGRKPDSSAAQPLTSTPPPPPRAVRPDFVSPDRRYAVGAAMRVTAAGPANEPDVRFCPHVGPAAEGDSNVRL